MEYYVELGGGLGDAIAQLHFNGSYNFLGRLSEGNTAKIAIISHNPFVGEIFKWHPNAARFKVYEFGYWSPEEAAEKRRAVGISGFSSLNAGKEYIGPMTFYPSPEDKEIFAEVDHLVKGTNGLILIAAGAGLSERNVPLSIIQMVTREALNRGYVLAQIGREYDRHGRTEPRIEFAADLINRLSVPGTLSLLQRCRGLLTGHSSMNIAGWIMRIPQLLVYPSSVRQRHFINRDQWAFGLDYPETVHEEFDDVRPLHVQHFLNAVDAQRANFGAAR